MLQVHLMNQPCITMRISTLCLVLALILVSGPQVRAQEDTTSGTISSASSSPNGESFGSRGALLILAGMQQGIESGAFPQLGMLVGLSPTITLGGNWELSPEVSLWNTQAYRNQGWYFKAALPVRWYAVDSQDVATYLVAGPGMLFSAPYITLDVGGGLIYIVSPSITLMAEVRTFLHDPTGGRNFSSIAASPVSVTLGLRLTPVK
jgi:hypothetical protein